MSIPKNYIVCEAHALDAVPIDSQRFELCVALAGEWKSRQLKVTDKELQQMADNFNLEGRDILFDFDHKCLGGFLSDADSRAAGWGKSMSLRDGALFVEMEPTPAGRAAIESGEYRYLSPVYEYQRLDRVTGKKVKDWRLHSVALTNVPFLTELPAIKNDETGGSEMDELLKRLGATDEESALAAVQAMSDALEAERAKVTELTAQVNAAEVDKAIADKKLLPAQKDLASKLINSSRELYDEFVAHAVVPDLTTEVPVNQGAGDGLDPFKDVSSFKDLLHDPALDAKMKSEDPARRDALYNAFMKEGK